LGLLLLTLGLIPWADGAAGYLLAALHGLLFWRWQQTWGPPPLPAYLAGFALLCLALPLHPWAGLAWKILLVGLLAGREWPRWPDRLAVSLALAYLLATIFALDLHGLFLLKLYPGEVEAWLRGGLLLLPLGLLALPAGVDGERRMSFLHGLAASLIVTLLALGSLVALYAFGLDSYPLALGLAVLAGILGLSALSALWLGFAGFEDGRELWGRQTFNSGGLFEQWLAHLTQPGIYKNMNPEQFLNTALSRLQEQPWVSGIAWQSPYGEGVLGEADRHSVLISVQSLDVTVYARQAIRGQRYAQVKLLIQLLEHFHQVKRREEAFAQQAHLKAIHETGAKLTHDIKNLLQSLHAITSAMQSCQQPEQFGETQRLLQGQLPHLSQRLKRTLEKLKQPDQPSYSQVPIRAWWDNLRARYRKREVDFSMSLMWNANIPEELFDNVVENLLENALKKRQRETGLRIHVALSSSEGQIRLSVCDDGSPVPPEIEKHLLSEPVSSRDGYGIGLYQVAKQVIQSGYRLNLTHNMSGQVCFELASV
jgi:signal transduction histidine kinase